MGNVRTVKLADGKYEYDIGDDGCMLAARRHGEDWPAGFENRFDNAFAAALGRVAELEETLVESEDAPPRIESPDDFVRALGDAVEAEKLPGVLGLDDYGVAGGVRLLALVLNDDQQTRVRVSVSTTVDGAAEPGAGFLAEAESAPPPARWALVEVMGHRQHAGRVSEETLAGVKLLRVEALRLDGGVDRYSYAPAAIFSLRDVTEAEARRSVVGKDNRACQAFTSSPVLPGACEHCGHDVPEHDAEDAERKREETIGDDADGDDADGDDDIPFPTVPKWYVVHHADVAGAWWNCVDPDPLTVAISPEEILAVHDAAGGSGHG